MRSIYLNTRLSARLLSFGSVAGRIHSPFCPAPSVAVGRTFAPRGPRTFEKT